MSALVRPESARFAIRDGEPVLTLAVQAPADLSEEAWGLINRMTLVLIDGPGDDGFITPRVTPGGDAAPEGWDDAVDRAGGSRVVFGDAPDAPGVFVRTMG